VSRQKEERRALLAELAEEMRACHHAVGEVDDAVCDRLRINRTDLRCLDILERSGPLTAGALAEASGLTTGAVTVLLDRLERAGYAKRVRDTVDRRRILVDVTPAIRQAARQLYGPLLSAFERDSDSYTEEQLRVIRDFVSRSRTINTGQAARIRAGTRGSASP
jgi:DNA-binding MarR family transcriptional regulator